MSSGARYLLDVNVLVALKTEDHVHHRLVNEWFNAHEIQWALCAFTESGFLRIATTPKPRKITLMDATAVLAELTRHPGYRYIPITADWHTLCGPLFPKLYGNQQVTDAYLLGLAIQEDLVLVTMDRAIPHMAGAEYRNHVLLLDPKRA